MNRARIALSVLLAFELTACASSLASQVRTNMQNASAECGVLLEDKALDPIRTKVELRTIGDAPPPFQIINDDSFATEPERAAILAWGSIRDRCITASNGALHAPLGSPQAMTESINFERNARNQQAAVVTQLIAALYQQKITYGEFAKKRYDVRNSTDSMIRQFYQQRATEAREAQQRADAELSAYFSALAARAPRSVNCMSTGMGNTVTANCTSN